jgi:pyrroline-5-carboxylate reductase
MARQHALGVIGAGAMGAALVRGFVGQGALAAGEVIVADVRAEAAQALAAATGVSVAAGNAEVVGQAEAVLLAVKPQILAEVAQPLEWRPGQLVISIAAGVSLARLQALTTPEQPLVRVMPNVLVTVSEGASAYAANDRATAEHQALVQRLLASVGVAVPVPERLLDAVTGLSGSGPAFAAVFLEALADGGVAAGLPRGEAVRLAAQTLVGVGRWVLETGGSPASLKDLVTSPGGTTIAGLRALEAGGLRGAAIEAVVAAALRSRELGQ